VRVTMEPLVGVFTGRLCRAAWPMPLGDQDGAAAGAALAVAMLGLPGRAEAAPRTDLVVGMPVEPAPARRRRRGREKRVRVTMEPLVGVFTGRLCRAAWPTDLVVGMPVEPPGLDPTSAAPTVIGQVVWQNVFPARPGSPSIATARAAPAAAPARRRRRGREKRVRVTMCSGFGYGVRTRSLLRPHPKS
jgi:hypothetical protein